MPDEKHQDNSDNKAERPEWLKNLTRENEPGFRNEYSGDYDQDILEQYKIHVDIAYKELSRFDSLNKFYASAITLVFVGIGYCTTNFTAYKYQCLLLVFFGYILSQFWQLITETLKLRILAKFENLFYIDSMFPLKFLETERQRMFDQGKEARAKRNIADDSPEYIFTAVPLSWAEQLPRTIKVIFILMFVGIGGWVILINLNIDIFQMLSNC